MNKLENKRIRHMLLFNLKYDKSDVKTKRFLAKSREIIPGITGTEKFEVFEQINKENDFDFGFYMEFEDRDVYQSYGKNPAHMDYIKKYWSKEVDNFMVIDFKNI